MTDNNKCPLCGKDTNEGDIFCSDCQEIAQNSYPDDLIGHNNAPEVQNVETIEDQPSDLEDIVDKEPITETIQTKVETTSRSNKKLYIVVAVGIMLMLLIGGISSYVMLENRNSEETETAFWNQCIEENSPLSYSKYLVRYPEGKYTKEAQGKIVELRENEKNEWLSLRNSKDIDALFNFLTDHPQTPYQRDIRHAIDSLSWVQTVDQNTLAAYQAYLDNVKIDRLTGEYEALAQERYDYLSQMKTIEGEELNELKKELDSFFKALSNLNSKDLQKHSAESLSQFFTSSNQLSNAVTDSVKADLKAKKIKTITYSLYDNLQDVTQDNKGIYFVSASIKSETTFTDRKKKKEVLVYKTNIELNKEKKVQSISLQ